MSDGAAEAQTGRRLSLVGPGFIVSQDGPIKPLQRNDRANPRSC